MKLESLVDELGLRNLTPELENELEVDVTSGHVSDMLSDVLAHAPLGGVLVTIQVHINAVAVAVHAGLAAIIFAARREPDEEVRQRSVEENLLLLATDLSSFEIVGRLHALGIKGGEA